MIYAAKWHRKEKVVFFSVSFFNLPALWFFQFRKGKHFPKSNPAQNRSSFECVSARWVSGCWRNKCSWKHLSTAHSFFTCWGISFFLWLKNGKDYNVLNVNHKVFRRRLSKDPRTFTMGSRDSNQGRGCSLARSVVN